MIYGAKVEDPIAFANHHIVILSRLRYVWVWASSPRKFSNVSPHLTPE